MRFLFKTQLSKQQKEDFIKIKKQGEMNKSKKDLIDRRDLQIKALKISAGDWHTTAH